MRRPYTPHTPQPTPAWLAASDRLIEQIIEASRLEDRTLYRTLVSRYLDEFMPVFQRIGAGKPELVEMQAILGRLLLMEWVYGKAR